METGRHEGSQELIIRRSIEGEFALNKGVIVARQRTAAGSRGVNTWVVPALHGEVERVRYNIRHGSIS